MARGDNPPEPKTPHGPRRVLGRGAATKVVARQQDLRALVARLVEHEVRIDATLSVFHARLARIKVAPVVKQGRPEAGALDGFQVLLGDDGVGVDIGAIERRHQTCEFLEFIHNLFFKDSTQRRKDAKKDKAQ